MISYTPAEQEIRAEHGEPPGSGADNPPAWHDHPFEGASEPGLPDAAAAVTPEWWRP